MGNILPSTDEYVLKKELEKKRIQNALKRNNTSYTVNTTLDFKSKNGINVEVVFHCDNGELSPFLMQNISVNETRSMSKNGEDVGNPLYAILIFHKEPNRHIPHIIVKDIVLTVKYVHFRESVSSTLGECNKTIQNVKI